MMENLLDQLAAHAPLVVVFLVRRDNPRPVVNPTPEAPGNVIPLRRRPTSAGIDERKKAA